MAEDYHIDMSGRIYTQRTIGIACVSTQHKKHNGCVLKGNLIKLIQKNLCLGSIKEEHAKIYAICIYLLIKDKLSEISKLIVCNDEEFCYVKEYLLLLLETKPVFEIQSITTLKRVLGRNIQSLADNYAKCYRKRGLNKNKWNKGKELDVVEINYGIISKYWKKLV